MSVSGEKVKSQFMTIDGRLLSMTEPKIEDIDFSVVFAHLGSLNRFAGAAIIPFSVARHSLLCWELAKDDIDRMLPLYMILHDAHEWAVGEITRPVAAALCELAEEAFDSGFVVRDAIDGLKEIWDDVIFSAAGVDMPSVRQRERMKHYDYIALVTEAEYSLAEGAAKVMQAWGDGARPADFERVRWVFQLEDDECADTLYEVFQQERGAAEWRKAA